MRKSLKLHSKILLGIVAIAALITSWYYFSIPRNNSIIITKEEIEAALAQEWKSI